MAKPKKPSKSARASGMEQPQFHNIDVTVQYVGTGGNSADGKYSVACNPEQQVVYFGDAVINYRLVPPTPDHIVFAGFEKVKPNSERQLSSPSLSVDGKMMTFSDRHTVDEPILIILKFKSNEIIMYDPEVQNQGGPHV
jgi:hypothetical protein